MPRRDATQEATSAGPRTRTVVAVLLVLVALVLGANVPRVLPTAWFRAGRFAYEHELHRAARVLLVSFAHRYPHDERAVVAVNLALDDLNERRDWAGLTEVLREVESDAVLGPVVRADQEALLR